jgi:hypothetical protein
MNMNKDALGRDNTESGPNPIAVSKAYLEAQAAMTAFHVALFRLDGVLELNRVRVCAGITEWVESNRDTLHEIAGDIESGGY